MVFEYEIIIFLGGAIKLEISLIFSSYEANQTT